MSISMRSAAAVAALCGIWSCTTDTGLSIADVAGVYHASSFSSGPVPLGVPITNILANGGTLTLTLHTDGTTSGTLVIPPAVNGGLPSTISMTGTFELNGATITFDQAADSFVRDMDFEADGHLLYGSQAFSGLVVSVTLTKT